jgi:hypothetical protein
MIAGRRVRGPASASTVSAPARRPCACTTPAGPERSARRSRSTAVRSPGRGRSPNSTGVNATPGAGPIRRTPAADAGPSTDTDMPRRVMPAASIRTCAPVPPAVVPTTNATGPGFLLPRFTPSVWGRARPHRPHCPHCFQLRRRPGRAGPSFYHLRGTNRGKVDREMVRTDREMLKVVTTDKKMAR